MFVDPAPIPVTCGWVVGTVAFCGTKTLGVTVAFEGSLLTSVMVTPPTGAGVGKDTGKAADCPCTMGAMPDTAICPKAKTLTVAVADA